MSRDIFNSHNWWWWRAIKPREIAKHPTIHRMALQQRIIPSKISIVLLPRNLDLHQSVYGILLATVFGPVIDTWLNLANQTEGEGFGKRLLFIHSLLLGMSKKHIAWCPVAAIFFYWEKANFRGSQRWGQQNARTEITSVLDDITE